MKALSVMLALAGLAGAASSAQAVDITYDTTGSSFSCGANVFCTVGATWVQLTSGGDSETISFLGTNSTTSSEGNTPENVSYGYLSFAVTGSAFAVPSGVLFNLNVSTNGGPSTLLSTATFSAPFGPNNPVITFSPLSGLIDATYTLSQQTYFMSAFSSAQIAGTVAAPEPGTWAMMLLGFAGVGFAAYRARGRTADVAA